MAYCDKDDLESFRPNILDYTTEESTPYADQIAEADRQINRALDYGWYRKQVENLIVDYYGEPVPYWQANPFDSTRLKNAATQITTLAVYKTLSLIYLTLAKDAPDDPFKAQADEWEKRYQAELQEVFKAGLDYDFSGDNTIDVLEKNVEKPPRTLSRC